MRWRGGDARFLPILRIVNRGGSRPRTSPPHELVYVEDPYDHLGKALSCSGPYYCLVGQDPGDAALVCVLAGGLEPVGRPPVAVT